MAATDRGGARRNLWASVPLGRFVLLCMGVWLHAADSLVTATIVPAMVDEIGGVAYVGWTISLYQIGAIVAGAATAMLCRRIGVKRVLVTAALLYGFGCAIAATAPNMAILVGARLVQGIGGGMLISLSYVAIQQSFTEHLWGRLFGVVALIWGAGSLLGPLIGGVFAGLGAWRWAFWFFAVQAGALAAMASVLLPAHRTGEETGGNWPWLPLLMLSAATLMIAEAGVAEGIAASILGCSAGMGLLYAAARLDRRSRSRLLPALTLDLHQPVGAGLLMVFALSAATTGFWAYGPLILKIMFGTSPLVSGYILAGEALAWSAATMAVSSTPLSAGRMLIRTGAGLVAVGAAGLAVAVPSGSLAGMVVCVLMQGLGFGVCWPSIVHRTVRLSGRGEGALAAAAPGTVQRIGYGVGAAAAGIAANASGLADGMSVAGAQAASFWVFAGFIPVLVVGMAGAWRFTRETDERRLSS
ncbi:MAG: MFS transporter [Hyphomicrobiales bacterium]